MQIYATATSPLVTGIGVGTGASKYTAIVTQSVNALASGSGASVTDQLNALQTLQSLLISDVGSNGLGILAQTNMADAQRAVDALSNAPIIQQSSQVFGRYDSAVFSAQSFAGGNANSAQIQLDALSRFSQDDQQIIFVGQSLNVPGVIVQGGQNLYYASVDAWKADLKQQAAAFNAQQQASATAQSSTVIPAISLPALPAAPVATAKPSIQTMLNPESPSATNADIALQLLLSAQTRTHAEAGAAAKAGAKQGTSGPSESGAKATQEVISPAPASSSEPTPAISQVYFTDEYGVGASM